jgi:hypothetical protein
MELVGKSLDKLSYEMSKENLPNVLENYVWSVEKEENM